MKKRFLCFVLVLLTAFSVFSLATVALAEGGGFTPSAPATPSKLSTPKISSVSGYAGKVTIKWGAVSGAAKYRVFYKTSSSASWKKLVDTASTSYTWKKAKANTTYYFTVRCLSKDGKSFTSDYDTQGKSIKVQLATPKISSVSGGKGNVTIKWGAVSGAAKYRVYYKTSSSGSWTKLDDTTSTSYLWTGAKAGKTYYFTVRCVSSNGKSTTSNYDKTGTKYTVQLSTPKISSVSGTAGNITIKWGKVSSAAKYRVYYKTSSSGSWKKAADTTKTSYTWKKGTAGKTYYFTVRCVSSSGKTYTSSYNKTGTKFTVPESKLATPKISSINGNSSGITIKWGAVSGAAKYRVFYKTTGSWKKAADTTKTSYTYKKAKTGTTYSFTVRCLSSDGKTFTSDYDKTGSKLTYVETPRIYSVEQTSEGIDITWNKVAGAERYRVLYKVGNSSTWEDFFTTTDSSYNGVTWSGPVSGTKYTFTVRAITADGKSFQSGYDTTGMSITYNTSDAPTGLKASWDGYEDVYLSWNAVPNAYKYRVLFRVGYFDANASDWITLSDAYSTYKYLTGATSGVTYTFVVAPVYADGSVGDYSYVTYTH